MLTAAWGCVPARLDTQDLTSSRRVWPLQLAAVTLKDCMMIIRLHVVHVDMLFN